MKKKPIKKKLPSIKSLRNKLDKVFNAYIRLRDGKCILCDSKSKLQCSHYYGKHARPATRWYEYNAHAMCARHHYLHHHGAEPDYSLFMFIKYGMAKMKILKELSLFGIDYTRDELNRLITLYTEKFNILNHK